ncbi:MAG: transporter-related protein [Deltaproteobacteria bacterium]|nr:transporter-related protein [Deltaproteobacteria bacterium]
MAHIEGIDLIKQYGAGEAAVLAVRDISFDIQSGEFVSIMGESGSGKSTLLSIIGALNTPTSGKLLVDGADVYHLGQEERADFRRQSLGFVFQNFHLIPYLTLAENVMLPLATLKTGKKKKATMAEEALDRVGLLKKANRLPSQISGGEQERVAIARAIVNRPPILLADEPTGNLDSKTGAEIMRLLSNLNDEGATVVMVTHSVEYARYAGRMLLLSDGQLVQESQSTIEKGAGGQRKMSQCTWCIGP